MEAGRGNRVVIDGNCRDAEQRVAAMRAPGREEGKDEVVVETMIEVSSSCAAEEFL